jgi:hypothetical protein
MGHEAATTEARDACNIPKILLCFRSRRYVYQNDIREYSVRAWARFNWLKCDLVIASSATVTNIRVSQKAENCSEQVSDYQLLKKDCALWCQSVCYTYLVSTLSYTVACGLRWRKWMLLLSSRGDA